MMKVKARKKRMYMISLPWFLEKAENFQMCITDISFSITMQNGV